MAKKDTTKTPNSQIRSALRRLFLRSREHSYSLRRDNYSCVKCHAKKSVAKGREVKVEVHHKNSVTNWPALFSAVREHLLCDINDMEVLCDDCHKDLK